MKIMEERIRWVYAKEYLMEKDGETNENGETR